MPTPKKQWALGRSRPCTPVPVAAGAWPGVGWELSIGEYLRRRRARRESPLDRRPIPRNASVYARCTHLARSRRWCSWRRGGRRANPPCQPGSRPVSRLRLSRAWACRSAWTAVASRDCPRHLCPGRTAYPARRAVGKLRGAPRRRRGPRRPSAAILGVGRVRRHPAPDRAGSSSARGSKQQGRPAMGCAAPDGTVYEIARVSSLPRPRAGPRQSGRCSGATCWRNYNRASSSLRVRPLLGPGSRPCNPPVQSCVLSLANQSTRNKKNRALPWPAIEVYLSSGLKSSPLRDPHGFRLPDLEAKGPDLSLPLAA